MSNEKYGRRPLNQSRNPYICGLTGKTNTASEVAQRVQSLARGIAKQTGWAPNDDNTPWDKVACIFSLNAIDYIPVAHAIHRLNGIVTPASAAYSAPEVEHQLRSSGTKILFTCIPLLDIALKAAKSVGITEDKIYLLEIPGPPKSVSFATVSDLIEQGQNLPELEPLRWTKGQGARQVAFLSYSSGTSGLPKAVMISHRNVISNVMCIDAYESHYTKLSGQSTIISLGLLPLSHIYGLIVIAHCGTYRGDSIIILPRFEMDTFLNAIERFRIQRLNIVPPIAIQILRNQEKCKKKDLSCVQLLYTGAAPMGEETIAEIHKLYPKWKIGQGYGMTETATTVCTTSEHDILEGSSGSLIPETKGKIMGFDGQEVTSYETPGELWVQSPSVSLGYLNNEKANAETFVWDEQGRWIKTGDEVVVRKAPSGHEHLVIVDRIKELIKVKGHQVAPAELEAHILTHEWVSDTAVIQVPDERAGELPKAFVVKSAAAAGKPDEEIARAITKHVEDHKARHKWLKGGVEFIEAIPKSPSGKILRRLLRDKEKAARLKKGAKL